MMCVSHHSLCVWMGGNQNEFFYIGGHKKIIFFKKKKKEKKKKIKRGHTHTKILSPTTPKNESNVFFPNMLVKMYLFYF